MLVKQHIDLSIGQQQARSRWRTHESGAAFDRKKFPYLTEQAKQFISQQAFCILAGIDEHDELGGLFIAGTPGFVLVLDEHTCLLQVDASLAHTRIIQRVLRSPHDVQKTRLGLFFIQHPTRERLCVHATAELYSDLSIKTHRPSETPDWKSSLHCDPSERTSTLPPSEPLWLCLHVRQAFFHCAKYIRTCVPGLTAPAADAPDHYSLQLPSLPASGLQGVTEEVRAFLAEQVLCFLCTVDQMGQCAVNHRNGSPGFLATLPPDASSPGGTLFLPDYAGNGAFEAIGNIFETGQAVLVVPNYAAQLALCLSGSTQVLEMEEVPSQLPHAYTYAQRVLAVKIQRVEIQRGDWSATLAYEQARATRIQANMGESTTCSL